MVEGHFVLNKVDVNLYVFCLMMLKKIGVHGNYINVVTINNYFFTRRGP